MELTDREITIVKLIREVTPPTPPPPPAPKRALAQVTLEQLQQDLAEAHEAVAKVTRERDLARGEAMEAQSELKASQIDAERYKKTLKAVQQKLNDMHATFNKRVQLIHELTEADDQFIAAIEDLRVDIDDASEEYVPELELVSTEEAA